MGLADDHRQRQRNAVEKTLDDMNVEGRFPYIYEEIDKIINAVENPDSVFEGGK